MVMTFMMMNGLVEVPCAISTEAMDFLDTPTRATPSQREDQFLRLRKQIEARTVKKFQDNELEGKPPGIVLRRIDF
jgi:hypothetical protein